MRNLIAAAAILFATAASSAQLPAIPGFPEEWKIISGRSCTTPGGDYLQAGSFLPREEGKDEKAVIVIKKNNQLLVQTYLVNREHVSTEVLVGDEVATFSGPLALSAEANAKMDAAVSKALNMTKQEFMSCFEQRK